MKEALQAVIDEGCTAETKASVQAAAARAMETDPVVASALDTIVADGKLPRPFCPPRGTCGCVS